MKGKAFIALLREKAKTIEREWYATGEAVLIGVQAHIDLLRAHADVIEIADEAAKVTIQRDSMPVPYENATWLNTDWRVDYDLKDVTFAMSYLDRRGLIERHPDKPHLIRFVEE